MLQDLQNIFNETIPISYSFSQVMDNIFSFYAGLSKGFYKQMPQLIAQDSIEEYFTQTLAPALFQDGHCDNIKNQQKLLLTELTGLEQFMATTKLSYEKVNQLPKLKQVADLTYDLLQNHTQLYLQYKNTKVEKKELATFLAQIDEIQGLWTSYNDSYSALKKILLINQAKYLEVNQVHFSFYYLLNSNQTKDSFSVTEIQAIIELIEKFHSFLQVASPDKNIGELVISQLQANHYLACSTVIPKDIARAYGYFFKYISLDNIKPELLIKQLLEMIVKEAESTITKAKITTYVKQFAKVLANFPQKGTFTLNQDKVQDHIVQFSSFINELEKHSISYDTTPSKKETKPTVQAESSAVASNPEVVEQVKSGIIDNSKNIEEKLRQTEKQNPPKRDIQFLTS